jgi:phosphate uptake regulator
MLVTKKVYRGGSKESYLVVLPKFWVKMHEIDKKREVKMIIEPEKIIIMPTEK